MRYVLTRTFPIPRREGFAYVTDLRTWELWAPIRVPDAEGAEFAAVGDATTYEYAPLGIRLSGTMTLAEIEPDTSLLLRFEQRAFPDVELSLSFENAGAHATTMTAALEFEEPNWWDVALHRALLVVPAMKRDLRRTLERLDVHFMEEKHLAKVE